MKWHLRQMNGRIADGQPRRGFDGPGKAFLWAQAHGLSDKLGDELVIMRSDGLRPAISGHEHERQAISAH